MNPNPPHFSTRSVKLGGGRITRGLFSTFLFTTNSPLQPIGHSAADHDISPGQQIVELRDVIPQHTALGLAPLERELEQLVAVDAHPTSTPHRIEDARLERRQLHAHARLGQTLATELAVLRL